MIYDESGLDAQPRHGGRSMVEIDWNINPFRGDRFEAAWRGPAEAALDYGASAYAFFRSKDDPLKFKQVAYFDSKHDWERYWYSEEISEARANAAGMFQVPLVYHWFRVVGADERTAEVVEG